MRKVRRKEKGKNAIRLARGEKERPIYKEHDSQCKLCVECVRLFVGNLSGQLWEQSCLSCRSDGSGLRNI